MLHQKRETTDATDVLQDGVGDGPLALGCLIVVRDTRGLSNHQFVAHDGHSRLIRQVEHWLLFPQESHFIPPRDARYCKVQLLSLKHWKDAHEFYRSLGFQALVEGFRLGDVLASL
ncbi:MAG: hypothetical protein ABSC00_07340 [Acidimicrobiales bacterium]